MKIKKDLKEFMDANLYGMAESHLECWKERYFGYTKSRLEFDLEINHDDSCDIEYAENELKRELSDNEVFYLCNQFHKEIVRQYINYGL